MRTLENSNDWHDLGLPKHAVDVLRESRSLRLPKDREEVLAMAMGGQVDGIFEVAYDTPELGRTVEATVTKCNNGLVVNYPEPYMRRRDPNCLVVGDDRPTDKPRFEETFGEPFDQLRRETFDWLKEQELAAFVFSLGGFEPEEGRGAILIAPQNAGFFIGALADLQGMLPPEQLPDGFQVQAVVYVAPPFRHTRFNGRQVVVHNRRKDVYEVFSYNLYPGPSAKKGIYGVLLSMGESEGWLTLHGSTVQVITPYDNVTTIMHEGASGAGKSEFLEYVHREPDGRLLLGQNLTTGEKSHLTLNQGCVLARVSDDMAMCPPGLHNTDGYLRVRDAEEAWFVRLNHLQHYGVDPHLEGATIHPPEPLIFLNLQGVPGASCLIWEHTEDAPGTPCPNPRVILPRRSVSGTVNGLVEVVHRNFGIRTPACTMDNPTYGIVGYLHILPPALAWLWRLVAPRGHANPSITDSVGLASEGVGSYWPFATGRIVDHANLLLRQALETNKVRYSLTPNQHVGAWSVSFMPGWIAREYLGRRGVAKFPVDTLLPSRCPLLGYSLHSMQVEGTVIPEWFLQVDQQPDVGEAAYDKGAAILWEFFASELQKFQHPELDPLGKRILECFRDNGSVADYEGLLPSVDAGSNGLSGWQAQKFDSWQW